MMDTDGTEFEGKEQAYALNNQGAVAVTQEEMPDPAATQNEAVNYGANAEGIIIQKASAPVKPMWICMTLAWIMFGLPIPFTVVIAVPLNIAALILAIVCLVRDRVPQGVIGLIGTTIVSIAVYILGFTLMAASVAALGVQNAK